MRISRLAKGSWAVIVGVVGNVRHVGLDAKPEPEVYDHYLQDAGILKLVIRTADNPATLVTSVRNEVWNMDKDLPVSQFKTMAEFLGDSLSQRRLNLTLLSVFAGVACILAVIGI